MATTFFFINERKFHFLLLFLLLLNLTISIGYPVLSSLFIRTIPGEMVTVYPNGTTELQLKELPADSTSIMQFSYALDRFTFLFPLTLLGVFFIPQFLGVLTKAEPSFFMAHFLPHIFLWSLAMISILFTLKYSKGISTWRKIIYVYLTAALIAGMGATVWSTLFTG